MSEQNTPLHPHTGQPLEPVYITRHGVARYPIMGASDDDGGNGDAGNDGGQDASTDTDTSTDDDAQEGSQSDDPKLAAARNEAASNRVKAREANEAREQAEQTARDASEALQRISAAINGDTADSGDADPSEQVTQLTTENQQLREQVADMRRVETVREQAGDSYDTQALLDSRKFMQSVEALDADADDYAAQVADAIEHAATSDPRFKVAQVVSRGGSPISGGSGENATSQADFNAMSYGERVQLKQADPQAYARLSGRA